MKKDEGFFPVIKISIFYILFSGLWILLSDRILDTFISDKHTLSLFQTYKGLFFVIISTLLIFLAIRSELRNNIKIREALKGSEARFRCLIESSQEGIFAYDTKMTYTSWNEAMESITGTSKDEVIGKKPSDIFPFFEESGMSECFRNAVKGTPTFQAEIPFDVPEIEKGGFLECSHFPLYDSETNIVGGMGIVRDITKRKNFEKDLKDSEELNNNILESMSDGIIVLDKNYHFTKWNKAMELISKIPREAVLGRKKHPWDVFNEIDENKERELLDKAMKGELITRRDHIYLKPDGIKFITNETFLPLRNEENEITGILVIIKDITETHLAKEKIRKSEEKYKNLFEETKDVVFIASTSGRLLDINSAGIELFGYAEKDKLLKGDIALDLFLKKTDFEQFKKTLYKQGFVKDYTLFLKNKDSHPIIVKATVNTVLNNVGEIIGFHGIMHDISEQKKFEQQMFQVQKMESISHFAGGIANDFKNILAGILGNASFLSMKISADSPLINFVTAIEKSAKRASHLIEELLIFSEGSKLKKDEKSQVSLNYIITECLKILRRRINDNISITTNLTKEDPDILADAGEIHQIIMNLLMNAGDAMPNGGSLSIETNIIDLMEDYESYHINAKPGIYASLTIKDTGSGIPQEDFNKIFEPFYTKRDHPERTGLGLTMVYGLVRNHGGFINVNSEINKGSQFIIYLPIFVYHEDKQDLEEEEENEINGGNETILIVDDEEVVRNLTKMILESYGYKIAVAENGEDGIEIYKEKKDEINLIILDLVLPTISGQETMKQIFEINPNAKIIISSGYKESSKKFKEEKDKVIDLIEKPFKAAVLLSKVRNALDLKK